MKNIKIKLEKINRLFQRGGFFGTLRVLRNYVSTYLKAFFVFSGDVLFVTSGVGDSAKYRAYNTAEELRFNGIKAKTTVSDNPRLLKLVDNFQVFVFNRTSVTPLVEKMIERIKEQKKEIIFDTDDLVYDPKYLAQMDYFQKMGEEEKKIYAKGIGAEIINDPYVKVCTTTVSYLAEKLREKNKEVFIVPNRMDESEWNFCQEVTQEKREENAFIRLVYISGTLSHNKDFFSIKDVLLEILEKHKNVKLYLMGPLEIPKDLNVIKNRIETIEFLPRREFFRNLRKADINLSPLELGNPFCESKSEIRFSGAAALGIPTVAVKNQTFSEAIEDGIDGFLAETKEEWVEKISRLVEDETLRKNMGEKAREKALRDYTTKNAKNERYYEFLRSRIRL